MKFELERLTEYSRKSIIAELRRVAVKITQKFITRKEFKKHAKKSAGAVREVQYRPRESV